MQGTGFLGLLLGVAEVEDIDGEAMIGAMTSMALSISRGAASDGSVS